jgi:radical SAM superfamily enzyme YgiQ (UPF0313 family)
MKALLLYPEFPITFWSFKYALKFISKKSSHPPLGLITVAAMLPDEWDMRLIDLNVDSLKDRDILWADLVFISAMSIQRESVEALIKRCKAKGKIIVAGGPLFTEEANHFPQIDHLVLNEAELTLPGFLNDLQQGQPKRRYGSREFPDISNSVLPAYQLLNRNKYAVMSLQLSRGCPFNCEFCEVTALFGNKMRLKASDHIIEELSAIYQSGWKGEVFFVDDNFIGNRKFLKSDLLPKLAAWMQERKHPFKFITEASINLSDDEELMDKMIKGGFSSVFVGIETPDEDSLKECSKFQNNNRNLVESVHKIQNKGMVVMGGFIVGFDSDKPSIFQRQIDFIQHSGIISAMVGLLNAPPKTKLYKRLLKENRIISNFSGNNTDLAMNFIPKMHFEDLKHGYQNLIKGIYSSKPYYLRVKGFLSRYQKSVHFKRRFGFSDAKALLKSILILGIFKKGRWYYWKLLIWTLFNRPKVFSMAVTYSIYGYHFRKVFKIK